MDQPYFSICIPQHNRTDFLLESLRSYQSQEFQNFEVCISDGGSTDGGLPRIEAFLKETGMRYVIRRSNSNLKYDANLRQAIAISSGRFLLLMGNDDSLSNSRILGELHDDLEAHQPVCVAICNYVELPQLQVYRRMTSTGIVGSGPSTAAATFRHYSFVSGIIIEGEGARSVATEACDGSEMYQMYLGSRLIGRGGRFLSIDRIGVTKDLQIPGLMVDSLRTRERLDPCPIQERPLPLGRILETVCLGLRPVSARADLSTALASIARQLYLFTYPFWIFEYRRMQSLNYALGVYIALRPSLTTISFPLALKHYLAIWVLYLSLGVFGFLVPLRLFDFSRSFFYRLAKR